MHKNKQQTSKQVNKLQRLKIYLGVKSKKVLMLMLQMLLE